MPCQPSLVDDSRELLAIIIRQLVEAAQPRVGPSLIFILCFILSWWASLCQDQWWIQLCLLWLAILLNQWLVLISNPALNRAVRVEFDTNHRLATLAVEVFVWLALHLVVLVRCDRSLQVVPEVGLELVSSLRKMNCECLIVDDCPSAFLASLETSRAVQYLDSEISLKEHIQRLYLSWQREI